MFYGIRHGIHYLDHFSFLQENLFGIQGAMTSYYQFFTNEEFSLSFDMSFVNTMGTKEDGFMLLLSSNPFKPEMLLPHDDALPASFEGKLTLVF